jgi:hypothetical protein
MQECNPNQRPEIMNADLECAGSNDDTNDRQDEDRAQKRARLFELQKEVLPPPEALYDEL